MGPNGEYRLSEVSINLLDDEVRFSARLEGPAGKNAWARVWISDAEGTLGEAASPMVRIGEAVTLDVPLPASTKGCVAYMRIESAPLQTEHVVSLSLG
jgi:hypothetical protein